VKLERALVVYRKSAYQIYVKEHRESAVSSAIRRKDPVAQRMLRSHQAQEKAFEKLKRTLSRLKVDAQYRVRGQNRSLNKYDLVISLGGDGTLLDVARYRLDDTPLLGINSDPRSSIGALCGGIVTQLPTIIRDLREGTLRPRNLTRLQVLVDDEPVLGPCLNDVLFCHPCPANQTRFQLAQVDGLWGKARTKDWQAIRGSGIWVCAPTGSTAAIRSSGGSKMALGSKRLQYIVREPYFPPGTPRGKIGGFIENGESLLLTNRVRQGRVWGDGPHRRQSIRYGQEIRIRAHPIPLRLIK
jgi:NAD+ kinase